MSRCLVMHNTLALAKQLNLFLSLSWARGQNQVQRINPASNSSPKHNILYNMQLNFVFYASLHIIALHSLKDHKKQYLSYFWMIQWLAYHPKKPVKKLKVKTKNEKNKIKLQTYSY